jgi:hypothetical protein
VRDPVASVINLPADPVAGGMAVAISECGEGVQAAQLIWSLPEGRLPWEPRSQTHMRQLVWRKPRAQ